MKSKEFIFELKKPKIKMPKQRDPNWRTLQAKATSGAGGQHRNEKRAEKQGDVKHKKDLIPMEDISEAPNDARSRLAQMRSDTQDKLSQMRSGSRLSISKPTLFKKPEDNRSPKVGARIEWGHFKSPEKKTGIITKVKGLVITVKTDRGEEEVHLGNKSLSYDIKSEMKIKEAPSAADRMAARAGAAPGSSLKQTADAYQQKLIDKMGARFGLPPGSTMDQVKDAQLAHLDKTDPEAAKKARKDFDDIAAKYADLPPAAGQQKPATPTAAGQQKPATPTAAPPAAGQQKPAAAPAAKPADSSAEPVYKKPTDDPDFAGGLAAAKAGKGPIAIMLAQPTIANNPKLVDVIASSVGLPAGSSVEEILAAAEKLKKPAAAPAAQPKAEGWSDQSDWGGMSHGEFKRAELQHELGHEDDPDFERKLRDKDRGPWYIRIDGKIYKQKGEPKVFDWKKGANNYALAILKNKPELKGKIFISKNSSDQ